MDKGLALTLSIIILVALAITFVVSFVLYKKTPVPAGCESLVGGEACKGCSNTMCEHHVDKEEN